MWARFFRGTLDLLFPPHRDVIAARSVSEEALMRNFRFTYQREHKTYTALPYTEESVRVLIRANKFYHDHYSAVLLGSVLGEALLAFFEEHALNHREESWVIAPIPTSKKRRDERGGNQVEWIIEHVPKEVRDASAYLPQLLARKHRESQTHLSKRERLANMRGTFSVPHPEVVKGRSILLIDDVIETGATIKDAMRALKAAGALEVVGLVLAK